MTNKYFIKKIIQTRIVACRNKLASSFKTIFHILIINSSSLDIKQTSHI